MNMHDMNFGDASERLRVALDPDEIRVIEVIERVKAAYIATDWDDILRRSLGTLMRTTVTRRLSKDPDAPQERRETRALIITGEGGTGKTESIKKAFLSHSALAGYGRIGSGCPLVSVSVPSPCTLKTLGMEILKALGYPLARDLKEHLVWIEVNKRLVSNGVLLLHLDEMHNLTETANVDQLDVIRKTLKALMASPIYPVGLVISGTPGIIPDLQEIDEIRRRGRFVRVPLLEMPNDGEAVEEIVSGLARVAGLAVADGFAASIAPRLCHAALGRFGILVEIVHEAIEIALVEASAKLDDGHFATAYTDRTGVGSLMNPFIAPAWADVDCSLVLVDEAPPEPVLPEDPPPRKRGRKPNAKKTSAKGAR